MPARDVLFEDPHAAHQIRLTVVRYKIAVSCTCRAKPWGGWGGGFDPLEARSVFPAQEALTVWRKHLADLDGPALVPAVTA